MGAFFYQLLENYMIQSMTGFGKATIQLPTKKITVEVKSLNSKGLDLNVRMPLFTAKWNWVYGLKLPQHWKEEKWIFYFYRKHR
jgi:hypothetical protein